MKRKQPKIRLAALIALITALAVLLNILTVVFFFNLLLDRVYVYSIKHKLTEALSDLAEGDYTAAAAQSLQTGGIMVTVLHRDTGTPAFQSAFDRPGDQNAPSFSAQLDQQIGSQTGSFFSEVPRKEAPPSHQRGGTRQAVTLLARTEDYDVRLSCMVGPLDDALALAGRFTVYLGLIVFCLSLPPILLIARRAGRSGRRIGQVAERLSEMDFSQRCEDTSIAELSAAAEGLNTMADRLEENVSRLRKTNEQLNGELAERIRQQRLSSELLANLSHDLKTPIAIISGYAEGITEGIARTPEQIRRYGAMIQQESEHMQVIVSKMLELGRSEIRPDVLELAPFDLSALLGRLLDSFQRTMEQEGIRLTVSLPDSVTVLSDPDRIKQVLTNYLQNAIFHRSGGDQLRVELAEAEGMAEVRIANSGGPFDGMAMDRLWEKLYRGDAARSRDRGQAGLGLAIVKNNMELLGQPYGVRNLDGMVEFYIRLPLAPGPR